MSAPTDINARMLRAWPLPMPAFDADKEVRGHVLIVAGSREIPGAVLLAATAALRAGAGKLTIATAAGVAAKIGIALPEARVIGLAETPAGGLLARGDRNGRGAGHAGTAGNTGDEWDGVDGDGAQGSDEAGAASAAEALRKVCGQASAVLIGPGMQDDAASAALARALLPWCGDTPVILDACAMQLLREDEAYRFDHPVLLTPHAGELAGLTDGDRHDIAAQPVAFATDAARRWNAVVALKGALTAIAMPDGRLWRHEGGNTGLAISGSGDVLAGLIVGLAARGAALEQAAAWGVALHAMAGEQLSLKHGPLGYLAREISAEVPALLRALSAD